MTHNTRLPLLLKSPLKGNKHCKYEYILRKKAKTILKKVEFKKNSNPEKVKLDFGRKTSCFFDGLKLRYQPMKKLRWVLISLFLAINFNYCNSLLQAATTIIIKYYFNLKWLGVVIFSLCFKCVIKYVFWNLKNVFVNQPIVTNRGVKIYWLID